MYNVSQNFLNAIKQNGRTFKSTVTIRGVIFDDTSIIDIDLEENVNPSDTFMLGGVGSSKLEVTIAKPPGSLIIEDAPITAIISLLVNGAYEDVPLGVFTVDDIDVEKNTVKITCYDNMMKLEKAYFSNLSYPNSINAVAQEICSKAGVQLATTLPSTQINKIEGYTYREAIGFIASFLGGFCRFNRIGKLEITSYVDTGFSVSGDNYFTLSTNQKPFTIGILSCKAGQKKDSEGNAVDNILTVGSNGNEIQFENPIMTQSQLNSIYNVLKNLSYMPYSMDWQGNQALQAGDKITITDVDNNVYNTLVMVNSINYTGSISGSSSAVGKTETSQEFSSSGSLKNTVDRMVVEQANINYLLANTATIENLTATNARIDNLYATSATIDSLNATNAKIENLKTVYATIDNLTATNAKIDNLVVGTAQIEDASITSAKIIDASIVTAKIADATITTAKIKDANITSAKIALASIDTAWIKDAAITNAKIGLAAIDSANIKNAAITSVLIGSGQILTANIADAQITSAKIGDAQITTAKIATAQITTALIADAQITSAKIALATITDANIASLNANKITTGTLDASKATITNINASNINTGTLSANRIAAGTITSDKLVTGTITAASGIIANATITSALIAEGSILTAKIADAQITSAKIALGQITDALIANATITNASIKDATITTAKIGDGQITNAKITDATIQSAKIASLDASKITTGTIDANRIGANTITTNKLIVGDFTNYASWADKGNPATVPWSTSLAVDTTVYHSAIASLRIPKGVVGVGLNNYIPVVPNDKIYIDFWIKTDSTWDGTGDNSKFRFGDQNGTLLTAWAYDGVKISWTHITGTYAVPSNVTELVVSVGNDGTVGNVWIDDIIVSKQTASVLIQDGSITANKMVTGTITAQSGIIADATITTAKIADGSIMTAKIGDAQITGAKIGSATIDGANIKSATILDANIQNGTISNASIKDATITGAKIALATIADANIANLSANKITTGTLDASKATISNINASNITTGTLSASVIGTGSITATMMKTGTITAASGVIASATITTALIADGQITTAKIADAQITGAKIANATIGNVQIGSAAIGTAQIQTAAITNALIGTNAVKTSQIADGSITDAKIVGLTANKITAGTIDAANIEVTNLKAANITVGTINGLQIASGTITAGNIQDGTVTGTELSTTINNTINTAYSNASSALINAANAQSTANGKNKAYRQATAPTSNLVAGDLWFDTSNSNRVNRWNGSSWELNQFGDAAISNLDAGTITSGTINANRIGANTITTDKLLIGDFTNLLGNPNYNGNALGWSNTGYVSDVGYLGTGCQTFTNSGSVFNLNIIDCQPGDQFFISCWYKTSSSYSGAGGIRVCRDNSAGSDISTGDFVLNTNWTQRSFTTTIPSGVTKFVVGLKFAMTGTCWVDAWECRRVSESVLIQDGAITADKLTASSVTAGKIATNAIVAGNIQSDAITTDKIKANAITSTELNSSSVTSDKIVADAVTAAKIASKTITANEIAVGTITSNEIKTNTITADNIASGAITASEISAGTITPDLIKYNAQLNDVAANKTVVLNGGSGNPVQTNSLGAMPMWSTSTLNTGFTVDLGGNIPEIFGVGFTSYFATDGRYIPSAYYIDGSTNNSTWTRMVTVTGNTNAQPYHNVNFGSGFRYIKLTVTATQSGQTNISVANFKVMSLQGGTLITGNGIKTNSITADNIAANTITANEIASNTITANEIKTDTITATSGVIANGAITDAMIKNATITNVSIATGTITDALIKTATITNASIASGTIKDVNIMNGTILNASIADATIQYGKIASIDASKITVGTISADRIASNTISTEKICISDFTNYCPNPVFRDNSTVSWSNVGVSTGNASSPTKYYGSQSIRDGYCGDYFSVTVGDKFYCSVFCWSSTSPQNFGVGIYFYDKNYSPVSCLRGTSTTNAAMHTDTGYVTVPSNAVYARVWTQINATSGFITWYFTNVVVQKVNGSTLIADGSITTNKIVADAITADKIAANTITATSGVIASGAITDAMIAKATITNASIALGTITDALIKTATITNASIASGTIKDANIQNGTILNVSIADGTIQDVKIANLNATKINAGTISADRIGANSITVDKLMVGDFTNLIGDDPSFENGGKGWSVNGTIDTISAPHTGTKALHMTGNGTVKDTVNSAIPCQGGDQFYAECWIKATGVPASGTAQLAATLTGSGMGTSYPAFDNISVNTISATWVKLSGVVTIPSGYTGIQVRCSIRNDVASGDYYFDDVIFRRVTPSVLIADGAITASKITTRTITADKLVTNTITVSSGVIATGAITDAMIANASITNASIKTGTITDALIANGTITNASIKDSTITNTEIANATIQYAKIASVDASKITVGTLSADRIGANTITVDKLLIGDMVNYAAWANKGNSASCPFNGMAIDTSNYYSATASYKLGGGYTGYMKNQIPVMKGDIFLVDFWAKKDSSWNGTANNSKIRVGDQDGNLIGAIPFNTTGTGWTHFNGTVSIATGDKSVTVSINNDASAGNVWIDELVIAKQNDATMIADGAITTNKILARNITTDRIATNAVTANEILTGTITATSGIIASIDAGKITTGTLDASKITVTNLNAGSITTGTLTGRTISGGTITGTTISASTLNSTSGTSSLTISGASIMGKVSGVNAIGMDQRSLRFYDYNGTGTLTGVFYSSNSVADASKKGVTIGTTQNYISFGKEAADGSQTSTDFEINYGDNPSGVLEKFIYNGDFNMKGYNIYNVNWISSADYDLNLGTGYNGSFKNILRIAKGTGKFKLAGDQSSDQWSDFYGNINFQGWTQKSMKLDTDCKFNNGDFIVRGGHVTSFAFPNDESYLNVADDNGHNYGINIYSSDITLKTNIANSSVNALETVKSMRFRQFIWKDSGKIQKLGVVAQELQQLEDSLVLKIAQPDGSVRMQPDETVLIPYLGKAIQELSAKIDDLQQQITELQINQAS
jgi:uncharacterized protein YjbI with pentapeptide repeats